MRTTLLLLREAERKLGVCQRLAKAVPDRRDPDRVRHAMLEMVMARASAIACGYEEAIDLDRLCPLGSGAISGSSPTPPRSG